jgi:hypothetical protein
MWFFEEEKPKDKIKMKLQLGLGSRSAVKIARLKGNLVLRELATKDHLIEGPREKVGKPIAGGPLEKLGLKLTITEFKPDDASPQATLKFHDPKKIVTDTVMVDATGKTVLSRTSWYRSGDEFQVQLGGGFGEGEPLAKDVRLKVTTAAGAKDVTIPFDLKDIPLP